MYRPRMWITAAQWLHINVIQTTAERYFIFMVELDDENMNPFTVNALELLGRSFIWWKSHQVQNA